MSAISDGSRLECAVRLGSTSWLRNAWLVVTALIVTGCATSPPTEHLQHAQYSQYQRLQRSELTVGEEEKAAALCPFGMPAKKQGWDWDHHYTEYVVHDGYALEHSGDYKIPLWVCERLDTHAPTHFARPDHFRPDPLLEGPRSELSDYRGSGYARGHQAPAEDFAWNEKLLDESFYLSNMSPQLGPFNSGVWAKLEKDARGWAEHGHPTWIITGPMFYDPAEENAATADGWIRYYTIGSGVAVPTHFYKIIVRQGDNGALQATAFVIQNKKPQQPYAMSDFSRSIQWIEERTGFDFMPDLEPADAVRLESTAGGVWPP